MRAPPRASFWMFESFDDAVRHTRHRSGAGRRAGRRGAGCGHDPDEARRGDSAGPETARRPRSGRWHSNTRRRTFASWISRSSRSPSAGPGPTRSSSARSALADLMQLARRPRGRERSALAAVPPRRRGARCRQSRNGTRARSRGSGRGRTVRSATLRLAQPCTREPRSGTTRPSRTRRGRQRSAPWTLGTDRFVGLVGSAALGASRADARRTAERRRTPRSAGRVRAVAGHRRTWSDPIRRRSGRGADRARTARGSGRAARLVRGQREAARARVRACQLRRCRGMLPAQAGDLDAAFAAYEEALAWHATVELPLDRGRTLLALGAAQRRSKRRREARETLEEALAIFERIGAALWAERARGELKRISGRAATPGALTPAEERVAALVAEGKTNREVAAALFLSDRTVEGHLSRIFGKLGIRHRAELAGAGASQTQGIARVKHGGLARFSRVLRSLASAQVVTRATRSRRRRSDDPDDLTHHRHRRRSSPVRSSGIRRRLGRRPARRASRFASRPISQTRGIAAEQSRSRRCSTAHDIRSKPASNGKLERCRAASARAIEAGRASRLVRARDACDPRSAFRRRRPLPIDPRARPGHGELGQRASSWPQIGIGFGIGLLLALGLFLAMRLTRGSPARALIWVIDDPVATETAPRGAVSVCARVTSRRGRRAEAVSQEPLAARAERSRATAREARSHRPAHAPPDRPRPVDREALVDAGLDRAA